mmetsp:Transcript_58868/g.108723  ORF Transcript_58868/g.108723 Transcript_58868/m.108723 type:complete len:93 (+) Transcript_58868:85-363(+)
MATSPESSVKIKILLFGPAREAMDVNTVEIEVPGGPCQVAALRKALASSCPDLRELLPVSRFSVNQELVQDEEKTTVEPGQEVAFIPPISGG